MILISTHGSRLRRYGQCGPDHERHVAFGSVPIGQKSKWRHRVLQPSMRRNDEVRPGPTSDDDWFADFANRLIEPGTREFPAVVYRKGEPLIETVLTELC